MKPGDYIIFKASSYTNFCNITGKLGRITHIDSHIWIVHEGLKDGIRLEENFIHYEIQAIDITTVSELERLFLD